MPHSKHTKPSPPRKLARWQISIIRGRRAQPVGTLDATTAEAALERAVEEWHFTDPDLRKRLAAVRVG